MKPLNTILENLSTFSSDVQVIKKAKKNVEVDIKNNLVIQHNHLVEARYRLSLQEKRLVLWLLTQIRSNDEDFKLHKLEIAKFAKITNLVSDSRYSELRKVTKRLLQRVIEIYDPLSCTFTQFSWLSFAKYYISKGYIELRFDPALKPYLLQLKSHFTKLSLSDMMQLASTYSIRFYELLKQYESIGRRKIDLQNLREYCGITKVEYTRYNDFKRKVLERAKKEINEKTDLNINYVEIKESRKIVSIEWIITKKDLEKQKNLEKVACLEKELRSETIIVNSLLEYGFSRRNAKNFITLYGEETIKNAIRAVNLQIERGKVKNPRAMLKVAIEEKWHPEIFKTKKKTSF